MSLFDLSEKIVLVTGAGQGIGFALAKGFAQAGARVYLNARDPYKLETALANLKEDGVTAMESLFDVTDKEQLKNAIAEIIAEAGRIDVLVNNAGIIKRAPLEHLEEEDWELVIQTDLTGPFMVSKYVAQSMIKNGGGKIINICSLMSEIGRDMVAAYAAAKGGLKMLTRSMATEWARHNIQTNGIGPGYIATPINAIYREAGNPLNDYIISRTPAGKWGTPEDLIGTALYLASPAADFVNGQIIYVDGGLLATFGNPDMKS
ncbi:MAG: SDR family oxidoreductase [Cyclobacteriaceae bacterium]